MTCTTCNVNTRTQIVSNSRFLASISSLSHGPQVRLSSRSNLSSREGIYRNISVKLNGNAKIVANENMDFSPKEDFFNSTIGGIKAATTANLGLNSRLLNSGQISIGKTDKFSGYKPNFKASSKLYPIGDVSFKNKFTNANINIQSPAYINLDEGVFTGSYVDNNEIGNLLSDDNNSIVFPSQVFNSGDLEYKFRVTYPLANPKLSYLAVRAYAPFDNYVLRRPQEYKIYDIKLEDPSGNLIIQYDDINIKGDNNFTTYISKSKINNVDQATWNSTFPYMDSGAPLSLETKPYTLTLNFAYNCLSYPFDNRFNFGYEQTCISGSFTNIDDPNPFNGLRISAIEIGNSGGVGVFKDNYLSFYSEVRNKSERVKRTLIPNDLFITSFNNGIYPEASSVWSTLVDDVNYNNATKPNAGYLLNKIRNDRLNEYITLDHSIPYSDSGRLILKFNTKPDHEAYDNYIDGAFRFGGSSSFNDAKLTEYLHNDNYFEVDSIELKVIARKATGSPDYTIDVVGYSDDKLLNVTSAIGGFLQNSGVLNFDSNSVPNISGFYNKSLSISDGAISDLSEYFSKDISPQGDHYIINNTPLINSTSFQEYTIPLQIYNNNLGSSPYSNSSLFENLYLDISPIPSGASICSVKLVIYHKPSNALMIHTIGSPNNTFAERKAIRLLPSSDINGNQVNTSVKLSGILTGLKTPNYIKSNYARRWRGVSGNVLSGGDFKISSYDYSFNHKISNTPFLTSYVDFKNIDDADIYDHKNNYVGQSSTSLNILSNFGWRYSSDQLFNDVTTEYKSISWKNNIFDAFDRAVRIDSNNSLELYCLDNDSFDDYGNPDNKTGFALFIRFSPDYVPLEDLDDNIIFAYENSTTWSMVLVCEGGFLKLKVKNSSGQVITISDTLSISNYQFPLSVLITYNDDDTYKFKLYTDNELSAFFNNLRAQSSTITPLTISNAALSIGSSQTYNASSPLPMFVSEIGCSNGICNIVQNNPNRFINQTSAAEFFSSHRMHFSVENSTNARSNLSTYIDDDISLWRLGDFKVCQFSPDFDFFTKKNGDDYLTFNLDHNGSGYNVTTDIDLPSNINLSGVCYHTQIENDFLRFNISNIPTVDAHRFHAIVPRISKTLPRGYQFKEEAICIDTIIEHETNDSIVWSDGKLGPKFIVSLYAPTQESAERPSKTFGLMNRSVHYLEPSGCIRKITTKFTFDDLIDESEPWAKFDLESYTREFRERYFLNDIDNMFLQYDVVYPSGRPINSTINIHSANIRLEEPIFINGEANNSLNLSTSGRLYQLSHLNLFASRNEIVHESGMTLFINSSQPNDGLTLFVFSSGIASALNLYTISIGSVDSAEEIFGGMFGSSPRKGMNIYTSGQFVSESNLPLYTVGPIPKQESLSLYINPSGYNQSSYVTFNTIGQKYNLADSQWADSMTMNVLGVRPVLAPYPFSSMSMTIQGEEFVSYADNYTNLFVRCDDPTIFYDSGNLNLYTLNYPISDSLAQFSATIRWDSNHMGNNITSQDNAYAYVDLDDNIRGVDLLCYGNCSSENKCAEAVIDIHGIKWYYPEICVDGGIFRAKNTYTNLSFPSGSFKHTENGVTTYDPMPYSGHFYGIRKYSGLAPKLPYVINITGKTGSSQAIDIPTEIIEIEYNRNEDDETSLDYEGFRISASNAYAASGNEFGKSIASKSDLLAVGSPKISIDYIENNNLGQPVSYTLQEAGTVFLYRRNERPSGYEWPIENYKSDWVLEKALTLPSGFLRDYSVANEVDVGLPFRPIQTSWFVGQEGRQFGHSLDLSVNNNKKSLGENKQEILVVGGPSAKWNRTFNTDPPSGVDIGLMIFTDEFRHVIPASTRENPFKVLTYEDILFAIKGKDLLFNYFSNPRIKFDVKIIICQPIADNPDITQPTFPDKPDFITLKSISRNIGRGNDEEKITKILNDIKSAFFEAFPSNIPPMLGLYIDNSNSLGRESLEPAIDKFIDFYQDYSFSGGLIDSYGTPSSGVVIEYVPDDYSAENWIDMSKLILSEVLDTGNLIANDRVKLLTNSVGIFDRSLSEFNVPPDSGGKVYIFEKESGSWNLIQEIKSPNTTYSTPDRFGHAVSISDDGDIIAIGSPYISQAVSIYEKKPEQKSILYSSVYNWIVNNRQSKYSSALNRYLINQDAHALYLALDQDDKFRIRLDLGIQEYQNVHVFDYSNMAPIGSWSFIPEAVAPTSRLGYSVDVNEDGSVVVAGAPTDSLNLYNDADVYYAYNSTYRGKMYRVGYSDPSGLLTGDIDSSWSSSLNAGSVHIFESRKYYPHNKAIEYGKFGNLHEDTSNTTPDSGHFHYLTNIFSDKNFVKTEFADPDIPQDAGLAFIITPRYDALSDEVYENIVEWLSFGDRNLVLVGNDPVWEDGGKYASSNEIINKILTRLQSRMRIMPARSRYESLPTGYSSFNNIVASFIPQGSTRTYVSRSPMRGSGVGDIKIYYPGYFEQMPCAEVTDCSIDPQKIQIQSKCEMPLKHYGDLRAQWNASCCTNGGILIYGYNWPLIFGSYTPACGDVAFEAKSTANFEPIPLLVAAEQVDQEIIYPAVPEQYRSYPIYETLYNYEEYYEFGSPIKDIPDFICDVENSGFNSLTFNVTNNLGSELFYRPYENGILQARGVPKIDTKPYISKELVSERTHFAIEYQYKKTTSTVTVLAGVDSESEAALYSGLGDQNIKFYVNLVSRSKTKKGDSSIAQVGGWTNRSAFKDGYDGSILKTVFTNNNNDVYENVLTANLNSLYNVAWIANINSQPSQSDLDALTSWLNLGNNKLVITCGNSIASMLEAQALCSKLSINIEPVFLPYLDQYKQSSIVGLEINQEHQIGGNYFFPRKNAIEYFNAQFYFYPFKLTSGGTSLAYNSESIYDEVPKNLVNQYWDMNAGVVELNVPVIAGSGYKIFVTTVTDSPSELAPVEINVENVSFYPKLPTLDTLSNNTIFELDANSEIFPSKVIDTTFIPIRCEGSSTKTFDIQTAQDLDIVNGSGSINIYISSAIPRFSSTTEYLPKSVKIVGISGVLIPIYQKFASSPVQIPTGRYENVKIADAIPEYRETIKVTRPISTDNTVYCTNSCSFLGGQLIEDGPVVAAQELEIISNFEAGVARSRITLITDSSMVQGRYVSDANGVIPQETYEFIRSLYPETIFPSTTHGRQYNVYNKLISPERGSPSKYYAQGLLPELNSRFGGQGSVTYDIINGNESKYNPKYISRPDIPWKDEQSEEKIQEIKVHFISGILNSQTQHASTVRFSGVVDGTMYSDAGIAGGIPQILRDKGYDYLDFDKLPSGYPGDLFGYSVSVKGNKILIGSPFSAFAGEVATPWSSGLELQLGNNGGGGSVYMFEKSSDNKWSLSNKFKPSSLMGQLSGVSALSDQFGHAVDIYNDALIIGAPNHSYENYYESIYLEGSFARKNFNSQFDIPVRNIHDLGDASVRSFFEMDGYKKNIGAIYLYENKITDWENKDQSWSLIQKVTSNNANERFGRSIYFSRPYRTDADYSIFAGCHLSSGANILHAGTIYAKDVMLRGQPPSTQDPEGWINVKAFGDRGINDGPTVILNFQNSGNNTIYYSSGIVVSNENGDIFIEVSGQDPSTKGFISHRPYVESIIGYYQYGKILENGMILHTNAGFLPPSSQMPLIINVENSAYVYNTLGLYADVITDVVSTYPSGLNLFVESPSGSSTSYMNMSMASGIGSQIDNLNLRVRGK